MNALGVLNALMSRAEVAERQDLYKDACSFRLREALYSVSVEGEGKGEEPSNVEIHLTL